MSGDILATIDHGDAMRWKPPTVPVWDEPVVRDPAGTVEVLMARGWDGHAAVAYAGQALFYAVNVFFDRCKALEGEWVREIRAALAPVVRAREPAIEIRLPPLRPVKPPPMWAVTPERERCKR